MLTKYRNMLHAFSPTLKRKISGCCKSLSLLTGHVAKDSTPLKSETYFVFAKSLFIRCIVVNSHMNCQVECLLIESRKENYPKGRNGLQASLVNRCDNFGSHWKLPTFSHMPY